MQDLTSQYIKQTVKAALKEDLGKGDITSKLTIDKKSQSQFNIVAKEDLILCGLDFALAAFKQINKKLSLKTFCKDGSKVKKGTVIMQGEGYSRDILAAERVALNFLQHMSGIASLADKFVTKLNNPKIKILDTRKTLPNYRKIAKYAVRVGGADNHRFCLDDGVLIKDNHIEACGSIAEAIDKTRQGTKLAIEVECETLTQVKEAVSAKADIIMLDNMSLANIKKAITLIKGKAKIEVSGNITLANIANYRNLKVDYISSGSLTHSPQASDISLNIKAMAV